MDVTLRDLVEQWHRTHDQRHQDHLHEHEREHRQVAEAVQLARDAADRRFDALLVALERTQIAATERTDEHYSLNLLRVEALERGAANLQGRFWALGVGVTLLTVALNIALPLLGIR